jgi:hypothetical protein
MSLDPADASGLSRRTQLILASAFFHGSNPSAPQIRASSARVLRHALRAAGLWRDEYAVALHGGDADIPQFQVVTEWYAELIRLVRHEPAADRLLDGAGNFIAPAGAHFTACWLTQAGRAMARRLLFENREWHAALVSP